MDATTPPRRNSASLLLGFALALLVVFLISANNRRVGMSLVRVLFNFNYGDIDVCGQLRGCTIMGRDAPFGFSMRTDLAPQVVFRLHLGRVLRLEPDPDAQPGD